MRLILAEYLRTLRERDEFDRLLPNLLIAMGYVPLSEPQTGARQFGVDLAVTGKSPDDGQEELLLFVLKKGDIGRREWDSDPNSVRQTLNEVLDSYLTSHVAPEYEMLRKKIVVSTTGNLKQNVEANYKGFVKQNSKKAKIEFWNVDKVASYIERYMLNENVFSDQDRIDLRKSLSLSGDSDYDFRDLNRLLLRQLGINNDGSISQVAVKDKDFLKSLRRAHLAAQVCASWAKSEGNLERSLWIYERTLLWCWHRTTKLVDEQMKVILPAFSSLFQSYLITSKEYFEDIQSHLHTRDSFSGYTRESAELAMILFKHLGFVSSIGLSWVYITLGSEDTDESVINNIQIISEGLVSFIQNNEALFSPRLDGHIIDINLAIFFLLLAGKLEFVKSWIAKMVFRLDYCFKSKMYFPVGTDSIDDLVEIATENVSEDRRDGLMSTSWTLATFCAWSAILDINDAYAAIEIGHREEYNNVCAQLWHPTGDWYKRWYFQNICATGVSEAPYEIPETAELLRSRICKFLELPEYQWIEASRAKQFGLWGLDFIACRHFRMPVPASAWYHFVTCNVE